MIVAGDSPAFVGDVTCIAELPVAATTKPPYNNHTITDFSFQKILQNCINKLIIFYRHNFHLNLALSKKICNKHN